MENIILAVVIFGLAFLALAIGVIFKRNCLRGSCQGVIQRGDGSGCRCGKYDFDKKLIDKNNSSLKPL